MRRNILLVDDDTDICEMLRAFLEHTGFVVHIAKDGFSGLIELHENEYDLLILDISMPHMSGFQVLKSIRGDPELKDLPVIMLTAHTEPDALIKVLGGVSDYVIKPPLQEDLICRIERVLGGRPQFQEVIFDHDDPLANGQFTVSIKLQSISKRGAVVTSPFAVCKNSVLEALHITFLEKLDITQGPYKVADCHAISPGEYSYFISFLGMSLKDQKKLQDWIMETSFKQKSHAG